MSALVQNLFGSVRLLDEHELPQEPQRWALKGVIPETGFGTIFGPSMSGKSFLALDLLAHLRHGLPWFGLKVPMPRNAVYVPFEGRGGIPNRIQAWRRANDNKASGIKFVFEGLNLRQPADRERLIGGILGANLEGCILCIDTLAQAGPGIDENSSEGMGEMIAIFQQLQARLKGIVLVIHHTGKSVDQGMRGWSGLKGALDFAIECQHVQGKDLDRLDRRFKIDKVKDAEDGRTFDFRMVPVSLGVDGDGDPVVSLTIKQRLREPPAAQGTANELNTKHDECVWKWINAEVVAGRYPSGRSLEGQREATAPDMSQKNLRDAIARLQAAGRLASEGSGNTKSLRAVELAPGTGHA